MTSSDFSSDSSTSPFQDGSAATSAISIENLYTPKGTPIADFSVSDQIKDQHPELVRLIMVSEAMTNKDRQHWFGLFEVMNEAQIQQLYDILTREQQRLNEIATKYNQTRVDPSEKYGKIKVQAAKRQNKLADIAQREKEQKQDWNEDDILGELN